jgi:RepB DNA-primase from phage plasmid/CHC2 zinc finger
MSSAALAAARRDGELECYLHLLAGHQPVGRLIEIRYTTGPGEMAHRFIDAADRGRARRLIRALAHRTDVYAGVLLRDRPSGGRQAVSSSHLVFIETDDVEASERLARFAHQPTMLVASGSPGHLHVYWQLHRAIGVLELEQANRRLAHHLGGDLASVDAARILRPPSSWNHKRNPPARVRLLQLDRACRYALDELVGDLGEPPGRTAHDTTARPRQLQHPLDQMLLAIPAERYVRALTGREPNRQGKVSCPFHDDSDPSLQLYPDGSWYCFACRVGGTVYDFAARLWGCETKDRAFLALRDRLARELGEPR